MENIDCEDVFPTRERNPVIQADRAVPASPAPNNKVVLVLKEVEPRTVVTPAPDSGCYAAPSKPSNARATEAGSTGFEASQGNEGTASEIIHLTGVPTFQGPQEPVLLNQARVQNTALNVLDTHPGAQRDLQPTPPRPEGEGSMDVIQLPDLLNELPDIEQLMATIEPLLSDCLFPSLGRKEEAEEKTTESCLPEEAVEIAESQRVSSQSQDLLGLALGTLDSTIPEETHICLPTGQELHTTKLRSSDDKDSGVPGSQQSCLRAHEMNPRVPTAYKGSAIELKEARIVLVPLFQQEKKMDKSIGTPIPGPIYIVDDGSSPAAKPKDTGKNKRRKSQTSKCKSPDDGKLSHEGRPHEIIRKRKCNDPGSKNVSKIPRISVEPGASKLNSDKSQSNHLPSKAPQTKGKRKVVSFEGELLQKSPGTNRESDISKCSKYEGTESTLGGEKKWTSHKHGNKTPQNVLSEAKGGKKLPQKRDQTLPKKGKIEVSVSGPDLLRKLQKSLEVDLSSSQSNNLQTSKNDSKYGGNQSQGKGKAKVDVNLPAVKGVKKDAQMEREKALKQMPRSNLALRMMDSVQVFYPLGKNKAPSTHIKKIPPISASSTIPEKPSTATARPPSKPLARPPPSSLSKAPPGSLPKAPSSSLMRQQPALLAKPLVQPVRKPGPKLMLDPSFLQPYEPKPSSSQVSQASGRRAQARGAGKTAGLSSRPAVVVAGCGWTPISACSSTLVKRQPPGDDPSASPPYEGATFIPWRTPPDDLEISEPITEEQRPIREMMKRRAQREREEAARWTSVGRVQFFVAREKEMDISIRYGYPRR
ncbi:uncharacterized protein C2orf78 homolog [Elgaria multicarinata webbii]|uniref:uncharacterized protein C2orf78 homolog n=1 Tax=Elgaria multicarinata webbii TaxID=159646 RepID=UPI002FCD0E6F